MNKTSTTKRMAVWLFLLALLLCLTSCTTSQYSKAGKLLAQGDYAQAALLYSQLGNYEDAVNYSLYANAADAGEKGNYTTCLNGFTNLGDFSDSPLRLKYYTARQYESQAAEAAATGDAAQTALLYMEASRRYHTLSPYLDTDARDAACIQALYDLPAALAANDDPAGAAEAMTAFISYMTNERNGVGAYADAALWQRYYTACHHEATGEYALAASAFAHLGTFNDAAQRCEAMQATIYDAAETAFASGDPLAAWMLYVSIPEYPNSLAKANESLYQYSAALLAGQDFTGARLGFASLGNYGDAGQRIQAVWYAEGEALLNAGDHPGAKAAFESAGDYRDASTRYTAYWYDKGEMLLSAEEPDYEGAKAAFQNAGDYNNADTRYASYWYSKGEELLSAAVPDHEGAIAAFTHAGDHLDAPQRIQECWYQLGEALLTSDPPDYDGAKAAFQNAGDYPNAATRYADYWYNKGEELLNAAVPDYEGAKEAFKQAGDHLDAAAKAAYGCDYQKANDLMQAGDYIGAYNVLVTLRGYEDTDTLLAIDARLIAAERSIKIDTFKNVGQYVLYGSYEQDNNIANGKEPIEWLVLEYNEEAQEVLLISRYGLDAQPYHDRATYPKWSYNSIRNWLQDEFFNAAFAPEEQAAIAESKNTTPDYNNIDGGGSTRDLVFLFSREEAEAYFPDKAARQITPTKYAVAQGVSQANGEYCWWWLRSPGYFNDNASYVSRDGDLTYYKVDFSGAIRPAIRLDLNALYAADAGE